MKFATGAVIVSSCLAVTVRSITFDGIHTYAFLQVRGGSRKGAAVETDSPPASSSKGSEGGVARAFLHAIEKVEQSVHDSVEAEVETLFHAMPHEEKTKVATKAKTAVQKGAEKVKQSIHKHNDASSLPFENHASHKPWPEGDSHKEGRILKAVESAENAVLHAVQDEVKNLFHSHEQQQHADDTHADTTKKAKKVVEISLKKSTKRVDDHSKRRRKWILSDEGVSYLEDYMKYSLE